jgi:hypothetical protein
MQDAPALVIKKDILALSVLNVGTPLQHKTYKVLAVLKEQP